MEIVFDEIRGKDELLARISGDCDLYNTPEFLGQMTDKINAGYKSICIDFSGVHYLDSSGVGAMIRIMQASKTKKMNIRFRGITGTPRKVLRMSNILNIIREDTE
jgi:anti-sigma B factor antagonist